MKPRTITTDLPPTGTLVSPSPEPGQPMMAHDRHAPLSGRNSDLCRGCFKRLTGEDDRETGFSQLCRDCSKRRLRAEYGGPRPRTQPFAVEGAVIVTENGSRHAHQA